MNRTILLLFLLIPSFLFSLETYPTNVDSTATISDPSRQKLKRFLAIADSVRSICNVPGVGISIVHEGAVLYAGGLGYADLENQVPVTENTTFMIGSTTKAFTGVLAGLEAHRNRLDWKLPIVNYLPDFELSEPYVTRHVNLIDAFTHMTGLSRGDELFENSDATRADILEGLKTLPFEYSFRGEWNYNNLMYVVAGIVLEKISGNTWQELIDEEILSPLDMDNSHCTYQAFINDTNRCVAYQRDGLTPLDHKNLDIIAPAGAISSTPKDLSNWLLMLSNEGEYAGNEFIDSATFEFLTGPHSMSKTGICKVRYYTIGWGASMENGKRHLRHSGAIGGQNARVEVLPEDDFGIFILTNQRSDYKELITEYAVNIFVNDDYTRNHEKEQELSTLNHFIRFRNTLLDEGRYAADEYFKEIPTVGFAPYLLQFSEVLFQNDLNTEGILCLKLGAKKFQDSLDLKFAYGKALQNNGQTKLAKKQFKSILKLDPNHKEAKRALILLQSN